MPLPPRDMTMYHLALNPGLAAVHARYPLSRYAPVMGMFRLYKLACDGVHLMQLLDVPSWLTLACLDDAGAEYCIAALSHALRAYPATPIYATLANVASPFLVPMLVPMLPTTPAPHSRAGPMAHAAGMMAPAAGMMAPVAGPMTVVPAKPPTSHVAPSVSTSTSAPASAATASSASSVQAPKVLAGKPADDAAAGVPVGSGTAKLHSTVLRMVCYLAMEHGVDMKVFEDASRQLGALAASTARQALREFGTELRHLRTEPSKALARVLLKYQT